MAARLLTRNDSTPASLGATDPQAISLVRVHGLIECFLRATAVPRGLIG